MNKNYKLIEQKYVEEISSKISIYEHIKTSARICTIENEDPNKVFAVAFRTPAINSTGLTHILEHSVLCGSKKYPCKDPFVELIKGSLNTFLNAFTFPDKTMYPIASQNLSDFKNLMSVYMDAVFYPQIYQHEEIFMQEGWHYHIENVNDPITYNGVVYNEMKGAFSNPEQILSRQIFHSLFPDTSYGFESGGDPKCIPDLSYEQFKNFHSKYYHPSNSYIFVYGDCDMEERLDWMDKEYLSNFEKIDFDTNVRVQKAFLKPAIFEYTYPVAKGSDLNNKTFLSYNVVFNKSLDMKYNTATDILVKMLFNIPGAPIKKALLEKGICEDVDASFEGDLRQSYLSVCLINSDKKYEEEFIKTVDEEIKKILDKGLDKKAILSSINFAEFKDREKMFSGSFPQGLMYILTCMDSWLYDESKPYTKLESLYIYDELRKDLENGYFEAILRDGILNNNHKSFVTLIPSENYYDKSDKEKADKLQAYKDSLSKEELEKLVDKCLKLKQYQAEEDTKEVLDTLPKLSIDDLKEDTEDYKLEVINGSYKTLLSEYQTNGICYPQYHFDFEPTSESNLQYLKLYTQLLGEVNTSKHSYFEISNLILDISGGVDFNLSAYTPRNKTLKVKLNFKYSALDKNVSKVNDLIEEIIYSSDFKDEKRLKEKIIEIKNNAQNAFSGRGHVFALNRAASYINDELYLKDVIDGVGYYDFICDLATNFESKKQILIKELESVKEKYLAKDIFTLSFTGNKNLLNETKNIFDGFYNKLANNSKIEKANYKLEKTTEGIKAPYEVNYSALVGKFDKEKYNGSLLVLKNAIDLDYLWKQVRVLGGAYGCFMFASRNGLMGFTSYRDPNLSKTIDTYKNIESFIKEIKLDDESLLKYKIGAIGAIEQVLHNSVKGSTAASQYFNNTTYADIKKTRSEIIHAKKEDITALIPLFEDMLKSASIVSLGNETKIDNESSNYQIIRKLTK